MKKRLFALIIMIFMLSCCVGISGFATGWQGTVPGTYGTGTTGMPTGWDWPGWGTPGGETAGEGTQTAPTTSDSPYVASGPTPTAPFITKNPGAETVQAGESCIFIAKADNYTGVNWYFTKGGQIVYPANAVQQFPGLKISGDGTEILTLESVPESLNGWSVGAVFSNAVGQQSTTTCSITVTAAPPTPTPTAASTPTPAPTPTSTPKPTATPAPTAAPVSTPAAAATPSASPTPEVKAEKPENTGFPIGLLLIAMLVAALLGGAIVLFILYRSGKLGHSYDEYDDYDDDSDADYDDDSDDGDDDYDDDGDDDNIRNRRRKR